MVSSRWIVLIIVSILTLIEFIGFSVQVYNWLAFLAVAALAVFEMKKFLRDRRVFRLALFIPVIIAIVFATPVNHLLSAVVDVIIRVIGVLAILVYFFYSYKAQDYRQL